MQYAAARNMVLSKIRKQTKNPDEKIELKDVELDMGNKRK